MTLPVSIDDVSYGDGSYDDDSYIGDLIITQGVIYFIPHTDVFEQKKAKAVKYNAPLEMHIGDLRSIGNVVGLILRLFKAMSHARGGTRLREMGLWKEGDVSEVLQARLDAHIENLKLKQRMETFSSSLPRPIRFSRDNIKNVTTSMGGVSIEAQYDKHVFRIGFMKTKVLKEALKEAGFIS